MESQRDSQPDLQRLLARQSEIQRAMRRPGGIRITVERELYAIREQLKSFPRALHAQVAEVVCAEPGADAGAGAGASDGAARAPHAQRP